MDANVEVNLQIMGTPSAATIRCLDISNEDENRGDLLLATCNNSESINWIEKKPEYFELLPNAVISYKLPQWQLKARSKGKDIKAVFAEAKSGLKAGRVDQFVRLLWEIPDCNRGTKKTWNYFQNGSPYAPFYFPTNWVIYYEENWKKVSSIPSSLHNRPRRLLENWPYLWEKN